MPSERQKEVLDFIRNFERKNGYAPSLREIASHFRVSIPTVHQHIQYLKKKGFPERKKGGRRALKDRVVVEDDTINVPLLGTIAAGRPIEAITYPETIAVSKNLVSKTGRHYALRVEGDSMIKEGIFDGDTVIVRQQDIVENGETAVALLNDNEATLKKIYIEKNRIRLQPANPNMEPFFAKRVTIQGKVVGVLRKF